MLSTHLPKEMDSKASGRCEPSVESEASLKLSTSRLLPAFHLEVEPSIARANVESHEQNLLHSGPSRRCPSDLPSISLKKDSIDNLDKPITRHRHRRRVDQPSSADRSNTPSHAVAARPKNFTTDPASSEYPLSGYCPRLSRILEHKDEDTASRLSGSPVDINQEQKGRDRKNDAINVDRERTARYRTYRLQQELSDLSSPSLSSLFSTLTTSSGSSGSSTVTQRSYDRSVGVRKKRRLKHRDRREDIPPEGRDCLKLQKRRRSSSMDLMDSQVITIEEKPTTRRCSKPPSRASLRNFPLDSDGHDEGSSMGNARPQSRASSQHSSSAGDSHHEEAEKEEEEDHRSMSMASSRASWSVGDSHSHATLVTVRQSPHSRGRSKASSSDSSNETEGPAPNASSIAAKRKSFPPSPSSVFVSKNVWKRQDTFNSDSGISVSSSPEMNARPQQIPSQQPETGEAESDDESSDASSPDEDGNEEGSRPSLTARSSSTTIPNDHFHPRALMDNDPLVQRLQEQEEEMRVHVDLHSPQPKRKFRPPVTSPCEPSPALPLFDHRASSTMPAHFALPPQAPEIPHSRHAGYLHPQYPHAIPPSPPFHPDPTRRTVAGYELLAEKLAQQSRGSGQGDEVWTPVYRKFAQLNHRILLHLQDEISLLEEELRLVDEGIAQRTEVMEGEVPPASRRMEMRYGHEPHHRRTELLGRIFQKLGQYNQGLASYASASKNYTPAQSAVVSAYRAWMAEHEPVDESESRFLEDEDDLMALKKQEVPPACSQNPSNHRREKLLLIAALLIPPVAISLVNGVLAKVVIMAILAFTGFVILDSQPSIVGDFSTASSSASTR